MKSNRFDVVVVGAGPAGITAAVSLGRAGYSVLVCEAAVYPGAENWSGAVYFTENLEADDAFGADVVEAAPYERRLVERGFYLYNGHSLVGGRLRDRNVFRSCYTVLRPVYDRYLAEVAREHGVVLANETTVQSLIRRDDRVVGVHTERGPAYADVVFLAEGDASHLVTQEGYELVDEEQQAHGAPHFLQGIKEVVSLPPEVIQERFDLDPGEGTAFELLLRNGTRNGRTARLNMGSFFYVNRDSVSLGLVLPVANLAEEFDGDHNLLMEWFKGLPEIARWIDGGEVTSFGTKIIRGGGYKEIPRLVDDGLAIGGAASGVGLDFPYPNFTGPATGMGLLFARAVRSIREEAGRAPDPGGPERGWTAAGAPAVATGNGGAITAEALERAYLQPLRQTRYWRDVAYLEDWPDYVERTQTFFETQLDVVNGSAFVLSRPELSGHRRWWEWIRLLRRALPGERRREARRDGRVLSRTVGLGGLLRSAFAPGMLGRWALNSITALLPSGSARTGGDEDTWVASARSAAGGELQVVFRVDAGEEAAGRMPWLCRWWWRRYGERVADAFTEVYTNDAKPLEEKLRGAVRDLIGGASVWDPILLVVLGAAAGATAAVQLLVEAIRVRVLGREPTSQRRQVASRALSSGRRRLQLDDDEVEVATPYATKLGTISYREGEHSHIKVLWPRRFDERRALADSPLWSVCPAKVYEVHPSSRGLPDVVVNYDNCIKCETCWRATDDVHWSRATEQRLVYETYTPTHGELRRYLMERAEPRARVPRGTGYWEETWSGVASSVAPTDEDGAATSASDGVEDGAATPASDGVEAGAEGDVASGVGSEVGSFAAGVAADGDLAAVRAGIEETGAGLEAYADELDRTPLTLEGGRTAYLLQQLNAVEATFRAAKDRWDADRLAPVRRAAGEEAERLWMDASERLRDVVRHAGRDRFFWSEVLAEQLRDHHLEGLLALLGRLGAPELEAVRAASPEGGATAGDDGWSWARRWRRVEAARAVDEGWRDSIAAGCESLFDSRAVRALEEGEPLDDEQWSWIRDETAAAIREERGGGPPTEASATGEGATAPSGTTPAYGRRQALLEELAAVDPSLAVLVSRHLLTWELLDGAAAPVDGDAGAMRELSAAGSAAGNPPAGSTPGNPTAAEIAESLRRGEAWGALVAEGDVSVEPLEQGEARVDGVAPLVPMAGADWLLVVDGRAAAAIPVDEPGVSATAPGCIGLAGSEVRRLVLEEVRVPADRAVRLRRTPATAGARDLLSVVLGAGSYLLQRARDHAAGRVQFPGAFRDEAGRETVAKFGAVKRMLAEMEAQRVLVETLAMYRPVGDEVLDAAVAKVLAAEAFGPAEGSFGYNAGQVFGGTAYSEDDVIAKYYRDGSPFRFLLEHDDDLRVRIGRRRLAAVREGGETLVPIDGRERAWLRRCRSRGVLADAVERWREGTDAVEAWAREVVAETGSPAAADDGPAAPVGDGLDEVVSHGAGEMVLGAVAAKLCLLRAAWRRAGGLPAAATTEAARLWVDRWSATAPRLVEEAGLLAETLAVGDDAASHGDLEPVPAIEDAEPYRVLTEDDHAHRTGGWLVRPFDASYPRYVPELLWNDDRLARFRVDLESELRERYVERQFDGRSYGRYLESIHAVPEEDREYLAERGFLRMPIPEELGGEEALKAEYYVVCQLTGRYGDASLSLLIMANTSIGTTPFLLGMEQDLPRARGELERVKEEPELLGEIRDGVDALLARLERPDPATLRERYGELDERVKARIARSNVLKYIGGGFLGSFFAAGEAGEAGDLDAFADQLREARGRLDRIVDGVDERLGEYPRRARAHEQYLKMISAGYLSAFALTEPTAGSDSGGVKTQAKLRRRRVFEDADGILYFFLDEEAQERAARAAAGDGRLQEVPEDDSRRVLLDADRLEFDYDGHRLLYRWREGAEPSVIRHDGYDYEKDLAGHWRTVGLGDRQIPFTDIAQVRADDEGRRWYEFWELNGAKMWITNGRYMHVMALYARTEPEGVTGFMVDRHAEGLVVGADEEKLGQRGSPTNELSLNAVRVPRECIIGFRGRGQVNALETLNVGRTGLSVTTGSAIQEMMEDAVPYLEDRASGGVSGGPPSARHRYWMGRLSEELAATSSVAYELTGLFDHPETRGVRMESAIGKYYGSEAQHDCIDWMERLRGAEGQTREHRIEKTRRDARVLNIYEGTNEVQRFLLLRDLVQRVLPSARETGALDGRLERDPGPACLDDEAGEAAAGGDTAAGVGSSTPPAGDLRHPGHAARLDRIKARLLHHLDEAVTAYGQQVWANVNLQPCAFRLAEIAGLVKVMDAVLYRMEWAARHRVPDGYRGRLERVGVLYLRRAEARVEELERRFASAFSYLREHRYPPEVQLGFLSLEEEGAAGEVWGRVPERLLPADEAPSLTGEVRIAVLLKPVPMVAPEPRLEDGGFAEALYAIDAPDRAALRQAMRLKARDREKVRVVACTLAGAPAREVLRQALAVGVDAAVQLDPGTTNGGGPVLHDPRAVASVVAGTVGDGAEGLEADLVLCGSSASDTGQGGVASYLAGLLGWEHQEGVEGIEWSEEGRRAGHGDGETPPEAGASGGEGRAASSLPGLRIRAAEWEEASLERGLPCVVAMEPAADRGQLSFPLADFVEAQAAEIERRSAEPTGGTRPLTVRHRPRIVAGDGGTTAVATTPEEAAEVILREAGLAGGGAAATARPYDGPIRSLERQPTDARASCLYVCETVAGSSLSGASSAALETAERLAATVEAPLDVVLPAAGDDEDVAEVLGQVLATVSPRRLYVTRHPRLPEFGWRGHVEWLSELWRSYRGRPAWLVGPTGARTTFARFVAGAGRDGGEPTAEGDRPSLESAWSWFDVEAVANGGSSLRVASAIFDGSARAEAELPLEGGLRVLTLAKSVDLEVGEIRRPGPLDAPEPAVFAWRPELAYDPDGDPVARLRRRLGEGGDTLEDAEFIVDVGYGVGGREGIDELAEPLRRLLAEELGLDDVMIGATRKVTQDLELLPMDRQIGQTGVRVNPKLLIALAVSGAPQHVDWIGERATILSFNIDPDAPLMRLNEQRPRPVVHPIPGDVRETVPRFLEALRAELDAGP